MEQRTTASGPLAGVKVVDMTSVIMGPFATQILASLGAEVIKVESPYGDESRHLGPKRGEERGPYLSLNRSKRDMVLDLQQPDAQAVFQRLFQAKDGLVVTALVHRRDRFSKRHTRI